ncbi:hypothetical protein L7F22_068637 [Adiantum nelumboides]|nr:hypothetical protein [Adiantum nelumboides]
MHILFFDGSYRKSHDAASGGIALYDPEGKLVSKKGFKLDAHSNNEAEYATLEAGLHICLKHGVKRLCIRGDALLVVKQVLGVWKTKNSSLREICFKIKILLKRFEAWSIKHIERAMNEEVHDAAQGMIGEIFVLKADRPLYCGREILAREEEFLLTGVVPKDIEKPNKYGFLRRAYKYKLIGDVLYMLGVDLVLRRVPWKEELYKVLEENHEGACGGHFALKITLHKILQEGYVWPSLHKDVYHWCRSCKRFQSFGKRVLKPELRKTILAYDVFEKWGIDAVGPLPITSRGKSYILTAVDYLSRWAEAKAVTEHQGKNWDLEVPSALWAYRTAVKTGTRFTRFHLVYAKEALLPVEVEIPAIKMLGQSGDAFKQRLLHLQEVQLDRLNALQHYEKMQDKALGKINKKIKDKGIEKGDLVLRYNSKLDKTFQKKFQVKWEGPFKCALCNKRENGSAVSVKEKLFGWRLVEKGMYEDEEEILTSSDDVVLKIYTSSHLHVSYKTLVWVYEIFFEEMSDGDWLLISHYLSTLAKQEGWSDQEYKTINKKKAYGYFSNDKSFVEATNLQGV